MYLLQRKQFSIKFLHVLFYEIIVELVLCFESQVNLRQIVLNSYRLKWLVLRKNWHHLKLIELIRFSQAEL